MPTPSGSEPRSDWYRYSSLGVQFAATIAVFGLLGFWLDGKWGTDPWLLIAFIFLGFFLGLISMVSKVSKLGGTGAKSSSPDAEDKGGT